MEWWAAFITGAVMASVWWSQHERTAKVLAFSRGYRRAEKGLGPAYTDE